MLYYNEFISTNYKKYRNVYMDKKFQKIYSILEVRSHIPLIVNTWIINFD